MTGYLAQASGAAFAGFFTKMYISNGGTEPDAITNVVRIYALLGGLCFLFYFMMNADNIEAEQGVTKKVINCAGINSGSMKKIIKLSLLSAVDAFGGAFIIQPFLALYYLERFHTDFYHVGIYLFICNVLSALSGIISTKMIGRFGALPTMIYTHLPSNIFLILIFFASNPTVSILLLFGKFCF